MIFLEKVDISKKWLFQKIGYFCGVDISKKCKFLKKWIFFEKTGVSEKVDIAVKRILQKCESFLDQAVQFDVVSPIKSFAHNFVKNCPKMVSAKKNRIHRIV